MGYVVRAYDTKLRREVALKRLRAASLDSDAEHRLIREAQAMAQLSHPNVVSVYDVELTGNGVTVAMELVEGEDLAKWLETERPWRAIVAAFRDAGEGLLAAHRAGLVHRDFKPANVLVSEDGRIKVTDFGLAKLVQATTESGSSSAHSSVSSGDSVDASITAVGTVMGTPRYMAPEQYLGSDADARSDQYALCVALWCALCGSPPFAGTYKEMAQAKSEGPPSWPKSAAVPRPIVDAIVRGLAPDRGDRWPSMEGLLAALAHDPARRRRRWAVGALAIIPAIGAAVGARALGESPERPCTGAQEQLELAWGVERSTAAKSAVETAPEQHIRQTWPRIRDRLDAYGEAWVAMHTDACEATHVRGEQSTAVLDLRMECLRRARVAMTSVVDLLGDQEQQVASRGFELVDSLPRLSRCSDIEALQATVPPPEDPQVRERVSTARDTLSRAHALQVAAKYESSLAIVESVRDDAVALGYPPLTASTQLRIGQINERLGRFDEAESALREALYAGLHAGDDETALEAAGWLSLLVGHRLSRHDEGVAMGRISLSLAKKTDPGGALEGDARAHLGFVLQARGDYEAAEAEFRRTLEIELTPEHGDGSTASTRLNLAGVLVSLGRTDEAERQLRLALEDAERTLPAGHPEIASVHNNLGQALGTADKPEQAAEEFRTALQMYEAALGPEHPTLITILSNLAVAKASVGELEEAETLYQRALAIADERFGKHPSVALTRVNRGNALYTLGRYDDAEAELRRALATLDEVLGPEHAQTAEATSNLGHVLLAKGELADAEAMYERTLAIREKTLPDGHYLIARTRVSLADAAFAAGRSGEAEELYRTALASLEREEGPQSKKLATGSLGLGRLLLAKGEIAEATEWLERAHRLRTEHEGSALERAEAAMSLADALWSGNVDRARARALVEEAAEAFGEAGEGFAEDRERARRWLDTHRA